MNNYLFKIGFMELCKMKKSRKFIITLINVYFIVLFTPINFRVESEDFFERWG